MPVNYISKFLYRLVGSHEALSSLEKGKNKMIKVFYGNANIPKNTLIYPYLDSIGNPTIGIGFVSYDALGYKPVKMSDKPITFEKVKELYVERLNYFRKEVIKGLEKRKVLDEYSDMQIDVLTSLAYNVGAGGFFDKIFPHINLNDVHGSYLSLYSSNFGIKYRSLMDRYRIAFVLLGIFKHPKIFDFSVFKMLFPEYVEQDNKGLYTYYPDLLFLPYYDSLPDKKKTKSLIDTMRKKVYENDNQTLSSCKEKFTSPLVKFSFIPNFEKPFLILPRTKETKDCRLILSGKSYYINLFIPVVALSIILILKYIKK